MTTARPASLDGEPGASSSQRLGGVDVARAVALLGMVAAHVGGVADELDWSDPGSWSAVVNGRSASLFAVLAGMSVGLVSGRRTPPAAPAIGRVRRGLALRAVVVVVVGLLLMALGTPVYVILPTYGVLFLLTLPVLRWRAPALVALAVGAALAAAPVAVAIVPLYADADQFGVQLGLVYPVVTFAAFVFVGLAVVRGGMLTGRRRQVVLLVVGAGTAAVAYTVGNLLAPVPADSADAFPGVPFVPDGADPRAALAQVFLSPRDHSSSVVDVVGTAGIALAVLALCTLLVDGRGPRVHRVVFPLVAVGAMPLSAYALHVAVLAAFPDVPVGPTTWLGYAVGLVLCAMVWRRYLGRGPLERLTARIAGTTAPR